MCWKMNGTKTTDMLPSNIDADKIDFDNYSQLACNWESFVLTLRSLRIMFQLKTIFTICLTAP